MVLLAACGGGGETAGPAPARPVASLHVEPLAPLTVELLDGRHVFRHLIVVRGVDTVSGQLEPLEAKDFDTEILIDGAPLDSESLLAENEIDADLMVSLVLDASYSMVSDHSPRAFEPMLAAARVSLERIIQRWISKGDTAFSSWIWFDDYIYDPWQAADYAAENITRIPAPPAGTDTRLFGAMDFMLARHQQLRAGGGGQPPLAAGPVDRHVMIVFTDGTDNRSHFAEPVATQLRTSPFAHERSRPAQPTSLAALEARLQALDYLAVYVIGFGSSIQAADLERLAAAANGQFIRADATSELPAVFDTISRQVTAIREIGARDPRPLRGPHEFRVVVRSRHDARITASVMTPFTGLTR
ncbi:MAG: VWA domain-containing protein [Planctomycetes bacterium]|nr:VWA domain-containing protein [Planctomycetota bacterium]